MANLRQYEAVYIMDPQLEEDQHNALVERFQKLITDQGGEVKHLERWERRRLAYEVKGRREGLYVVMNFDGLPAVEAELNRVFRITDGIIRHLVVKMDPRHAERAIADAKAQAIAKAKAQAEAEVRAAAEAQAAAEAAAAAAAAAEAARAAEPAPAPAPVAEAPAAEEPAPVQAAAEESAEAAAPAAEETPQGSEEETGTA